MSENSFRHVLKAFKDLSPGELYQIIRLRNEVFIVEQRCVYQDADNKDIYCHHLMLFNGNDLTGYARLVPPGISYDEMSIGRVVIAPTARRTGAGKKLMELCIHHCYQLFGRSPIRIGAQTYVRPFYNALGFSDTGATYDEDGIEHVQMIRYYAPLEIHG